MQQNKEDEAFLGEQSICNTNNTYLDSVVKNIQIQTKIQVPTYKAKLDYNLPDLPQYKIDRNDDIYEIERLLTKTKGRNARRVILTGMAGIGKTTLAVMCAQIWQEKAKKANPSYKNFLNIVFLQADNRDVFETSVIGLAVKLKIKKNLPTNEILKTASNLYNASGLLLIIDNLEKVEDVKEILSLPKHVYVIATSQNSEQEYNFQEYPLKVFPPAEAIRLMYTIFDRKQNEEDNEKLKPVLKVSVK